MRPGRCVCGPSIVLLVLCLLKLRGLGFGSWALLTQPGELGRDLDCVVGLWGGGVVGRV